MAKIPIFAARGRRIRAYTNNTGQSYAHGAALLLTTGKLSEAGANPAAVIGFAAHPVSHPYAPDVDLLEQLVFVAGDGCTFWGSGSVAPLATHVGQTYGLTKGADGIWIVDIAKVTTDARVRIESVDLFRGLFEFSVLAANRILS